MAIFFTPTETIKEYPECEVHHHASGQYSIVFDGYRFLLPECRSVANVIEHLEILKEAFERGFVLTGNLRDNEDFLFYDPEKDIPV